MKLVCVNPNPNVPQIKLHDVVILTGIRPSTCRCAAITVSVNNIPAGIPMIHKYCECMHCGSVWNTTPADDLLWQNAERFRPLDELLNEEIQELLQPQTVEV